MNWHNEKDRKTVFSVGLLGLAVLMLGFTAAEVINIARGAYQSPFLTKEALEQIRPDKERAKQYLDQYQKAAADLTQNNMFVPPPDTSVEPGDCIAILGDEACFGENRWVRAGDRLGDADVVAVGPVSVTLLWEGRNITRAPVLRLEDASNRRTSGAGFARNQRQQGGRPQQRGMGRGNMGRGQMRGGGRGGNAGDQLRSFMQQDGGRMVQDFMNMSNDQRVQAIGDLRQRFQGGTFEIRTSGTGPGGQNVQFQIIR